MRNRIVQNKQDMSRKCLIAQEVPSRWAEYCSELNNHENGGETIDLDCNQRPKEDLQLSLREEVDYCSSSTEKGKDNILAELVRADGETMIDV